MDNKKLEAIKLLAKRELAKREFSEYCKYVNGDYWILGKHLKYICDITEKVVNRETKENILIISMPPQNGKSQCISETLPSYYLGKNPNGRVIEVSYGDDLAKRFGRANKRKLQEFGQELFNISLGKATDTDMEVDCHRGTLISRGIMAGITGQPGDLIIVDDPLKNRAEAESETYRNRVWEEFLNSIYTRLSAKGVIIIIMTRWHEDDLVGRVLKNMPQKCIEINIPLEAEENDPLGRKPGEALFPEIGKDNDWLKDFKEVYISEEGSKTWNALMQGHPTSAEGNMFKTDWWEYYTTLPKLPLLIMTVDATFKDTSKSDYVAIGVWGKIHDDYYLVDMLNKRMGFVDTCKAVKLMRKKHRGVKTIYVEDKANGSAIIDTLRREIGGVVPYNPGNNSKEARASSIAPLVENRQVFLPMMESFTESFVEQCRQFPQGTNDDMVDSMSMALILLKRRIAKAPTKEELDLEELEDDSYRSMVQGITGGFENFNMFGGG